MEGPPEDRGVNYRTLAELFAQAEERAASHRYTFQVRLPLGPACRGAIAQLDALRAPQLSVLEIYNEDVHDLLADPPRAPGASRAKLEIRRVRAPAACSVRRAKRAGRQASHGTFVEDLTQVEPRGVEDVVSSMEAAGRNRAVGSHNVNEHSSRSHLVLSVTCLGENKHTGARSRGRLHLIDLAGSERVGKTDATGARLKEAQHINKSLSALGDVVQALSTGSKHVPYRNSKLTYLLQESLSGDSKVCAVVRLPPALA